MRSRSEQDFKQAVQKVYAQELALGETESSATVGAFRYTSVSMEDLIRNMQQPLRPTAAAEAFAHFATGQQAADAVLASLARLDKRAPLLGGGEADPGCRDRDAPYRRWRDGELFDEDATIIYIKSLKPPFIHRKLC